jgi:hypothetical protein
MNNINYGSNNEEEKTEVIVTSLLTLWERKAYL